MVAVVSPLQIFYYVSIVPSFRWSFMRIANPIYDVVFKYLFDDNKVAKLFLSAILGEEVLELSLRPQEQISEIKRTNRTLTVYYLDFAARIKAATGEEKLVIIEIQKAKFAADLMRFRKYLGEQYRNPNNTYSLAGKKQPLPIISLYFLGYPLDHVTVPVVKVNRQYVDLISGELISERETFIESLSHDSYVIQIPYLGKRRQNDLEKLLAVFDQRQTEEDTHILNVKAEDFPEKYQSIIRRLQMASEEQKVRDNMTAEDNILEEFQNLERALEKMDVTIQEKDTVIQEKITAIQEKDTVIQEKSMAIQEKDVIIQEKDAALELKDRLIQEQEAKLQSALARLEIMEGKS